MPSNERWKKSQIRQAILACFFLVLLASSYFLYANYLETRDLLPVTFLSENSKESKKIYLEVAATKKDRAKGLMFRKDGDMPRSRGMIFIFPTEEQQSFWMKNTFISLDMIFVNSELEVVGVIHNVPPLVQESQKVQRESIYVIEVLAGVAKELNVKEGDKLKVYGKLPKGL